MVDKHKERRLVDKKARRFESLLICNPLLHFGGLPLTIFSTSLLPRTMFKLSALVTFFTLWVVSAFALPTDYTSPTLEARANVGEGEQGSSRAALPPLSYFRHLL